MHSCMENILELLKPRSQQVHLFREILPEDQPAVRGRVRFHTSSGTPCQWGGGPHGGGGGPLAEGRNAMRLVEVHQVEVGGHNRKASRRAPARLVGAHPVPFNGGCRGVTELGGLVAPDSRVLSALSRRRGCWRSWLGFWRSVSCLVTGQGSCSSKQGPIAHALLHSRKNESRNDHHVFSKDPL